MFWHREMTLRVDSNALLEHGVFYYHLGSLYPSFLVRNDTEYSGMVRKR